MEYINNIKDFINIFFDYFSILPSEIKVSIDVFLIVFLAVIIYKLTRKMII